MFDHFIHVWESPEDVIATSVACVEELDKNAAAKPSHNNQTHNKKSSFLPDDSSIEFCSRATSAFCNTLQNI
jgi:hypothetical protein